MHSVLDATLLLQLTMVTVADVFACVLTVWLHRDPVFWNARIVKSSQSLSELDTKGQTVRPALVAFVTTW